MLAGFVPVAIRIHAGQFLNVRQVKCLFMPM